MPRSPEPSNRQRVLAFVRESIQRGHPPTVREVQRALGFRAVQSAKQHLDALLASGALQKESGKARGYRLPELEQVPTQLVPLLGRVQAGALQSAFEHHEGHVPIEARRLARTKSAPLFALRVRGDSMVGAGIFEGDLVIVRQQATAENGDIVVAQVGDEATVKRFHRVERTGGRNPAVTRVELRAENPAYPPIVLTPPAEPVILGKVIELRRHLDGHRQGSRR